MRREDLVHEPRGRLDAALLLHAHDLVPDDFPPVAAVLVRLDDGHRARVVVDQADGLLLGLRLAVGDLAAAVGALDLARLLAARHDDDAPPRQLVLADDQAQRRERRRVVLDQAPVVDAQHAAAAELPPGDRLAVDARALRRVEVAVVVVVDEALVALRRRVDAQKVAAHLVDLVVAVRVDADLVVLVRVANGRVEPHDAAALVVDRADLEALLVAADQPRLLPAVARRAAAHDRRLREDARAAVRVGALARVDGRERDAVLVVLAEVEVAAEPGLDAAVLPHQLDEFARRRAAAVVQPAAAVDDVVVLQHAQPGPDRRRVREDEDLPALARRVRLHEVLEPGDLRVVDDHLVRRVLGLAEDRRPEADEQRLLGDLARELRAGLAVDAAEGLEVLLVRGELVDALEVVVAADDLVVRAEAAEELGRELVAGRRAREELRRVLRVDGLRLAEVAEADDRRLDAAPLRVLQNLDDVLPAAHVVVHLARVHVQIPEDRDAELVPVGHRALVVLDAQLVGVKRRRLDDLVVYCAQRRRRLWPQGCSRERRRGRCADEGCSLHFVLFVRVFCQYSSTGGQSGIHRQPCAGPIEP